MEQTNDLTLTQAESLVMRSILTPLRLIMEEAMPSQTPMEDDIFFNIALPLLTHIRTSLITVVSAASLWRQIRETIQLKCMTDGQWHQMGDYAVLMVRFGIHDNSVTGMQLAWSMRMAHWGPPHMCIMQLIPRAILLSTGFFDETELYTANLSRLWPATNWEHHARDTSTGSMANFPFALSLPWTYRTSQMSG